MKVTIFGGTGRTGKELVRQAHERGHDVTLFVRSPEKVDINKDNLSMIVGQMNEPAKIREAIAGADAVISALGPIENVPKKPLTEGMKHIVSSMQKKGVDRLIVSTGAGVQDPNDTPDLIGRLIGLVLKLMAKHVLADSEGMVEVVRQSDLKWTVARAPRLTDGPGGGTLVAGYAGQGPGTRLSRSDLARFMLDQLESNEWINKAPMVSN